MLNLKWLEVFFVKFLKYFQICEPCGTIKLLSEMLKLRFSGHLIVDAWGSPEGSTLQKLNVGGKLRGTTPPS